MKATTDLPIKGCHECPFARINNWDIGHCNARPKAANYTHAWEKGLDEFDTVTPPEDCPLRGVDIRVMFVGE